MRRIGVGLYSMAGVYGPKDENEIEVMLNTALKKGVEFFDVAPSYGDAEEMLGKVLNKWNRQVVVATKTGLTEEGERDGSYEYVIESCKKSLRYLRLECIPLYQIHYDDPKTPVEETMEALEDLKKEGLIQAYGLGHMPPERVQEYGEKGTPSTIMLEVSPLALHQYETYRDVCNKYGISILAMGCTGRGLLTGKLKDFSFPFGDIRSLDPTFHRSFYDSSCRVYQCFKEAGQNMGKTPVQIAIAWVLNLPGVERALIGPSRKDSLEENIGGEGWELIEEIGADLNRCVEKEGEMRKEIWKMEMERILSDPLPEKAEDCVKDLIFTIEGMITFQKAEEEELIPLFQDVIVRYRNQEKSDLNRVQKSLNALYCR